MDGVITALDIGKAICRRRQELGMTQEALAERIEVTSQQIQRYEYGRNKLNVENLQRIAKALDVPVAYFFDGLGAPQVVDGLNRDEQRIIELYREIGNGDTKKMAVTVMKAMAQGEG